MCLFKSESAGQWSPYSFYAVQDAHNRQPLKNLVSSESSNLRTIYCWTFTIPPILLTMKLTLPSVFLLLAAVVSARVQSARQQCPEAARFGEVSITPSSVAPGDMVTVKADFTCSFSFGIRPIFTDYHIEVPVNNNGHEPPILLARRQPFVTPASPIDQFEVQIPFAPYVTGANYVVNLANTYPINGTNGSPVLIVGGVETVIIINSS